MKSEEGAAGNVHSGSLEEQLEALHSESYAWALACCGRRADEAEEVLQTVYLKIIEGKARFGGKSSLKTWLFSVIRHTAAGYFRWRRIRERHWQDPQPSEASVETLAEQRESARNIIRALARISTRQRQVLELVFYHDMTIEEAAATLGLSVGSARVHYHRGKQRLAELLKKEEGFAFA